MHELGKINRPFNYAIRALAVAKLTVTNAVPIPVHIALKGSMETKASFYTSREWTQYITSMYSKYKALVLKNRIKEIQKYGILSLSLYRYLVKNLNLSGCKM